MPVERKATSVWNGSLKDGAGSVDSASGSFRNLKVTFRTRFENEPGANPEELIAGAHASCFSMALAGQLAEEGLQPKNIATTATVTLVKTDTGFGITKLHLETEADVPDATEKQFMQAAENAKAGCPVSKLLAPGLETLTLDAKLKKTAAV